MGKILIAGDWHMNHRWAQEIISVAHAEGINRIIQVGDFGVWPGKDGAEYLRILSGALVDWDVKLYFVPGNHEDWNQIDSWSTRFSKNQDGHQEIEQNLFYAGKVNSWTWDGKRFASVGGAVSIDKKWRKVGLSWWPQEIISYHEKVEAIEMGKVDYLFTHDCHNFHPFSHLKNDLDSTMHRQTITEIAGVLQPSRWFHGHYHEYAEYEVNLRGVGASVWALDADDSASHNASVQRHTRILDISTGQVTGVK